MLSFQWWDLLPRDQHFDRSSATRNSGNQLPSLECQNHGVHGRRRYSEIALKVGFRRRSPMQLGVRRDVRQVLTLNSGKRIVHMICFFLQPSLVQPSNDKGERRNQRPSQPCCYLSTKLHSKISKAAAALPSGLSKVQRVHPVTRAEARRCASIHPKPRPCKRRPSKRCNTSSCSATRA